MSLIISFDGDWTQPHIIGVDLNQSACDALFSALKKPLTHLMTQKETDWGAGFEHMYNTIGHIDLSDLTDEAFWVAYDVIMRNINHDELKPFAKELQKSLEADPRFEPEHA